MSKPVNKLSDLEITSELVLIEGASDDYISTHGANAFTVWWDTNWRERYAALNAEAATRKEHSAPAVVRLRFLAGESGRRLDAACAEALGWRVDNDPWWNWVSDGVYAPPGDDWCIRRDGRLDLPCNEALPTFTAESFEHALNPKPTP